MSSTDQPYFIESLVVGDIQVNCYVFGCAQTKDAAIIDPGGDADQIISMADSMGINVKMILLTHGHYDHIGGLNAFRAKYHCPVLVHVADEEALTNPMVNLSALTGAPVVCEPAEQILEDGDVVKIGKVELRVIHTPGHTPGSICFYREEVLVAGDLLFFGSIGRTDLPGGSYEAIESSIIEKVYTLPDDTIVYPGHGEPTTVGYEKMHNQFVRLRV